MKILFFFSDTWGDSFSTSDPDWDLIIASDILLCKFSSALIHFLFFIFFPLETICKLSFLLIACRCETVSKFDKNSFASTQVLQAKE